MQLSRNANCYCYRIFEMHTTIDSQRGTAKHIDYGPCLFKIEDPYDLCYYLD